MASALSISPATTPAPPAARGVGWIDVETAAKRSGLDERHIRRLCGQEWFARGLARQLAGKGKWEVREDADARLARIRGADDLPADLKHLTTDQSKLLLWKKAVLSEWDRFNNSDAVRGMNQETVDRCFLELLGAGKLAVKLMPTMKGPPTDRTLRNWQKQSRAGLLGLTDRRGIRYQDEEPPGEDPFFQCFKQLYLVQQKPDIRFCWKMACYEAGRRGWMPRSESQTRRFEATIPAAVKALFRGGNKTYNDKFSPYIERDYSCLRVNEVWNADHHQFDVMVSHEGRVLRPWLTAFQDVRSRKILGWQISADGGNTETILAAMVRAMDEAGVPEETYFDWGKDFASKAVGGIGRRQRMAGNVDPKIEEAFGPLSICGTLGIKVVHCQPYHGQSKPIERHFGTMRQFSKTHSTYCGNTTAAKPENLPAKLERGAAPELADFVESFSRWVVWHNECDQHQGDGMNGQSPALVFQQLLTEKRSIPAEIRTLMSWKPGPLTKVGRNGVRCNKLTYGVDDHAFMIEWQGKEVSVRIDPQDANRAAIHDRQGVFICMARCNEKLGWNATAEQKAKAIATIKRRKKVVREYHEALPRLSNSIADEMWEQQAEESRRAREASAGPVTLVTVSTPMNHQLGQIQRALDVTSSTPRALPEPPEKSIDLVKFANDNLDFRPESPRRRSILLEWSEQKERDEREAEEIIAPAQGSMQSSSDSANGWAMKLYEDGGD